VHGDFKNGFGILVYFDRNIANLIVLKIDVWVLLPAATTTLFGCEFDAMRFLAVQKELNISVKAFVTATFLALVQLCLCMAPMMLPPVATGCECLVAKLALEWPLTGVHSLMNLEVRLVTEFLPADTLTS